MEPEPFYKNVRMLAAVAGAVALLVLGAYYFLVIKKSGEPAAPSPAINDLETVTQESLSGEFQGVALDAVVTVPDAAYFDALKRTEFPDGTPKPVEAGVVGHALENVSAAPAP